jgi:hypothetical protein
MAIDVMQKVGEFTKHLERELGDNLVSLLLYGPAVRREGTTSEATTLMIVRDASPEALRPVASHIASWSKKGNPPPLIFSELEWRSSSDVFPIEIEDMREAHILISGEDPLEGIETTKQDLRAELEREIRGKLLRLRTEFAAVAPDGKALGSLLIDSSRTFFVLFRATLRLVGRSPPDDPDSLVNTLADVTGLDASAFEWILAKLSDKKVPGLKSFDPIGHGYLKQIERLEHFVDSYDVTRSDGAEQQGE